MNAWKVQKKIARSVHTKRMGEKMYFTSRLLPHTLVTRRTANMFGMLVHSLRYMDCGHKRFPSAENTESNERLEIYA